jgi:endonuclease/exonuclease/phosphatase family metal-dependent hydrolase
LYLLEKRPCGDAFLRLGMDAADCCQTPGMNTLRVVTLNVGSLFEPHWERRAPRIARALAALEPDVVCLQEIADSSGRPNAAQEIVDAIGDHGGDLTNLVYGGLPMVEGLYPDEPDLQFGSAVLSRFPVELVATHALPVDGEGTRASTMGWELVHARTAGLDIFSTHLCAAPTDANHRRVQVQEINRLIQETRTEVDTDVWSPDRPEMPPILCGDFNAEPDSDEIRFLCGLTPLGGVDTFYQDSWRVAADGSVGHTNDWANPFGGNLNVHRKRIDYVFVGDPFLRRGSGGRVIEAHVVLDEEVDGVPLSDHLGVMALIAWPNSPG